MNTQIPSTADVKARLGELKPPALVELARLSGVPFHTILKIRTGVTENPGIETVRKFSPFLADSEKAKV